MNIKTVVITVALAVLSSAFGSAVYSSLVPGTSSLAANDDSSSIYRRLIVNLSSPSTAIGFTVNFFGTNYTNLFANNNGNVTFGNPLGLHTPFGLTTATARPIIAPFLLPFCSLFAPFFADVDTRSPASAILTFGGATFTTNDSVVRNGVCCELGRSRLLPIRVKSVEQLSNGIGGPVRNRGLQL